MRIYDQQGAGFTQTNLSDDDQLCRCCQSYHHEAPEYLPAAVECATCGMPCRCACHQDEPGRVIGTSSG